MLNNIGSKFVIRIRNNSKKKINKNEIQNIRYINYTFDSVAQKKLFKNMISFTLSYLCSKLILFKKFILK